VGKEGIKVDPGKTQVIQDWPRPTSVKEVRSFLGLANYFRKFMQGYSSLVEPLTALTRKELAWNQNTWDSKCEEAFQGVKVALTTAPTLSMPDLAKGGFEVICDASLVGIGAVLTQDGNPIAYESRKFSAAERNWPTGEQEHWAVIHALQTWRCYLEGVPFKVITDHNPLTHLPTQATLSRKQARWSQYLQQFDFQWEYRPGRTNVADPLSRIPNTKPIKLNAVTLKTLTDRVTRSKDGTLKQPKPRKVAEGEKAPRKRKRSQQETVERTEKEAPPTPETEMEVAPPMEVEASAITDLLAQLKEGYRTDEWFSQESNLKSAGLSQRDGLWLTRNEQVAVPNVPGLRQSIIYELHDVPYSGHVGVRRTQEAVRNLYWWPKWATEVKDYVLTCASCQRNKHPTKKPAGVLHPLPIPRDKWESVSMDFITQLPPTGGPIKYDAIVVFVDRLTKMVRLAPTTSNVTAEGTAQLLHDHVFRHHGVPKTLITDRGSVFTARLFQEFMKKLETKHCKTTAYHPQSDGQTERTNQTLETMLRHYVGNRAHGDWHLCLAAAEFAINNAYTPAIGTTPFRLNYGRQPRLPVSVTDPQALQPQDWADRMIYGLADAKRHIRLAQERQKKYYDKGRSDIIYSVGERVMLNARNISLRRVGDNTFTPKLLPKWIGPYTITEVIGKGAYRLDLPPAMKAHPVFNVVSLKPFLSDGRDQPPPPTLVDGELEFTIDQVLEHGKTSIGDFTYLVSWKGYGPEFNTWQSQESIEDNEAFDKYWAAQGLEPPVHATTIQAIKARTAKLVYAQQALSFPLSLPDPPCWKL
jgi:transposase InsO family protein